MAINSFKGFQGFSQKFNQYRESVQKRFYRNSYQAKQRQNTLRRLDQTVMRNMVKLMGNLNYIKQTQTDVAILKGLSIKSQLESRLESSNTVLKSGTRGKNIDSEA